MTSRKLPSFENRIQSKLAMQEADTRDQVSKVKLKIKKNETKYEENILDKKPDTERLMSVDPQTNPSQILTEEIKPRIGASKEETKVEEDTA